MCARRQRIIAAGVPLRLDVYLYVRNVSPNEMPADAPDGGFAHHRVERSTHTHPYTQKQTPRNMNK